MAKKILCQVIKTRQLLKYNEDVAKILIGRKILRKASVSEIEDEEERVETPKKANK
jgi:hypothetical protein